MSIINRFEPIQVGDYARCMVPLKKPSSKWGKRSIIVRNVTVTGIVGDFIQVRVPGRKGTVTIKRTDIESFWRYEDEPAERPCSYCGHPFDHDALGPHGCPDCHGEGME